MAVGGVAVFPTDTVYGLACEPESREAVAQLYLLKRRRPEKPAAGMFFSLELALAALPGRGARAPAARRRDAAAAHPARPLTAALRAGPDHAGPPRPGLAAGAGG